MVVWQPPPAGLAAISEMGAETNIADKALTSIVQSAELVNYVRSLPMYTMRAELIGHFKPCMTEIYLHI